MSTSFNSHPPMSREEAEQLLRPHLPTIRDCLRAAWTGYQGIDPAEIALQSPRTRASEVHDRMTHEIRRAFEGRPGMHCLTVGGLFLLAIGDDFLLRFKKLNDRLHSSNIETQQVLEFMGQGELPGIPKAVHLEAGYVLNRLQTDIAGIHIVCPGSGRKVQWSIELEEASASVIVMPPAAAAVASASAPVSVKDPKRKAPSKAGNEPID